MHLTDGELRAYQDHELSGPVRERVKDHLAGCVRCREQAEMLRLRSIQVDRRLTAIAPLPSQAPRPLGAARARLEARISEKENTSMLNKIFSRPYRKAWAAAGVVALLALALAFPPVQAIANSFLGLFRVQQVNFVQVNPGNLPDQLGSSSQFESLMSKDVHFEKSGETMQVANAGEATSLANFKVRLPAGMEAAPSLKVQPSSKATLTVDMQQVRAVLDEIGRSDIQLPDGLDGATVSVEIPTGVIAQYGQCRFDPQAARQAGQDPDNPKPLRLPNCTTFMQMPSPSISAPPGLDIAKIGEAYLEVMGMTKEQAASFAQNVDWTTTLVVPIPRYSAEYQDVTVDGVTGTLIEHTTEGVARDYLLLWVKDGIIYALTGPGDGSSAVQIAGSLQ